MVPLPVRLFRARLDKLESALATARQDVAANVKTDLRGDLATLPPNNVVVRDKRADLDMLKHPLRDGPALIPQFAFRALGLHARGGGFLLALLLPQVHQQSVGGRQLCGDLDLQAGEIVYQGITTRTRRVGVVGNESRFQVAELLVETFAPPFGAGDFGVDAFPSEEHLSSFCWSRKN
jgi:hypothetical protein